MVSGVHLPYPPGRLAVDYGIRSLSTRIAHASLIARRAQRLFSPSGSPLFRTAEHLAVLVSDFIIP